MSVVCICNHCQYFCAPPWRDTNPPKPPQSQQHLFMMDEVWLTDEKGAFIRSTVSKDPLDDWTALLEKSWGPIEITHVVWLLGGQEAIYTL